MVRPRYIVRCKECTSGRLVWKVHDEPSLGLLMWALNRDPDILLLYVFKLYYHDGD
jgi:hypothetical protein